MNNVQLKKFVKSKLGTAYVYGMKGTVMSKDMYNWLKKTYPSAVWNSDIKKIGKVCVDCSGLISWAGVTQMGSAGYKSYADKHFGVHPISTIKEAPRGVAVWRNGHIGVYIGLDGKGVPWCVEAKGSQYGVVRTKVFDKSSSWTHWFKLPDVEYNDGKTSSMEQKNAE